MVKISMSVRDERRLKSSLWLWGIMSGPYFTVTAMQQVLKRLRHGRENDLSPPCEGQLHDGNGLCLMDAATLRAESDVMAGGL